MIYNRFLFNQVIIWSCCLLSVVQLGAQTVPVGLPFFDDALRRGQLMGRLDSNVSFMIRPLDAGRALGIQNPFGLDSLYFPSDTLKYGRFSDVFLYLHKTDSSKAKLTFIPGYDRSGRPTFRPKGNKHIRVSLLPIYTHTRYNGHHPYGWSDGAMIPARGLQQYISGGVFVKVGPLEAQFRPEYVWAQNREFQNPPFRPRSIDFPERMGQDPYKQRFLGQSYVKLHLGPMALGWSNENVWWGPGLKNAIIMSNNAPGFGHFTVHTNKPIKSRYGTFEGQMMAGKLNRSGFVYPLRYPNGEWPPVAGDVVPDTSGRSPFHSFVSNMKLVYQPKWTPGLFLGITRVIQASGEPKNNRDYIRMLYLAPRGEQTGNLEEDAISRNQLIAVSARYLFKESHAEIYFELGREDFWWDLEDLMTRTLYSTAWLAGIRKLYVLPGKDRWLQVFGEYTKIQAPFANLVRPTVLGYSFYTHSNEIGWTHRGQVMGAGIGPGSNMNTLGVSYGKGFHTFSLQFERVVYNEDMMYTAIDYLKLGDGSNPFFVDISKHFVDWGFLLSHHTSYNKFMVGYQLHLLRTYNFQWNYDPLGLPGPFRFPGINAWSLNAEISCVYRF